MIIIRLKNKEYEFVKPYYLMELDSLKMIKAVVKSGQLVWNIGSHQLSYNEIKKLKK